MSNDGVEESWLSLGRNSHKLLGKVESLGGKSIFFKKSSLLLVSAGSKDQTFYAHSKNIYKCVLKIKAIFHNSVGGGGQSVVAKSLSISLCRKPTDASLLSSTPCLQYKFEMSVIIKLVYLSPPKFIDLHWGYDLI